MTCLVKEITIDGEKYVRASDVQERPSGNRYVLVLDRGWIVAGNVLEENGRIKVSLAVHVRSWSNIGFDGMLLNPKSKDVVIRALPWEVDVPKDCEIFRVHVADSWGL